MLICNVVGARPNFMKMAPVIKEMRRRELNQILLHTGQHYDEKMSHVFFEELEMPYPDVYLGVGSDSHARQTAKIMTEFEIFCLEKSPALVVVGGDVNSTLAVSIVASKLHIPVAHVESGLRSFDRTMPEEINRIVTDHLSDILFTTELSGNENLQKEGVSEDTVHFVGNCMIDTLYRFVERAIEQKAWNSFDLHKRGYALLTLHRPSNVDNYESMINLSNIINAIAENLPIIFPVHPRTMNKITLWNIEFSDNVRLCKPLSYLDFLGLMFGASFVLTDSGGIQEETTTLEVPCLTLRDNTERPSTITYGTNSLVGTDRNKIISAVNEIVGGNWPKGQKPPLWDGQAANRVVDVIENWIHGKRE